MKKPIDVTLSPGRIDCFIDSVLVGQTVTRLFRATKLSKINEIHLSSSGHLKFIISVYPMYNKQMAGDKIIATLFTTIASLPQCSYSFKIKLKKNDILMIRSVNLDRQPISAYINFEVS